MHSREDDKPVPAPPASIPEEEQDDLNGDSTETQEDGHLQSSDRAPSTLDKQIAQDRMAADMGTPAGLPRVATSHTAQPKQDGPVVPPAVHGAAHAAESDSGQPPDTPGAFDPDVGHLPVARQENTPERGLDDPGHMTPSSSPRQLVRFSVMAHLACPGSCASQCVSTRKHCASRQLICANELAEGALQSLGTRIAFRYAAISRRCVALLHAEKCHQSPLLGPDVS